MILFDPAGSTSNKLRDRMLWHMQANIKAIKLGKKRACAETAMQGESAQKAVADDPEGRENMLEDGKRLSYEHR